MDPVYWVIIGALVAINVYALKNARSANKIIKKERDAEEREEEGREENYDPRS